MRSLQITCRLSELAKKNLRRRLSNEVVKPVQAGYLRYGCGRKAKVLDFHFGLFVQPVLVGFHASRRAESHLTVATCAPTERAAAMVATDCHERCVPELAG
jgi:hypothetical protein